MKRTVLAIALVLSLGLNSNVWAEGNEVKGTNNTTVRTIKAPRFARPLVEKWIKEYAKTQPGVEFQIAKGQGNTDLNVVLEDNNFSQIVFFGETAVLPITARSSEAARLLEGKHLNNKKLKQLFFLDDEFDEDVKKNKAFEAITVYSGSNATSVASSFAHNLGEESSSFRGKRIFNPLASINPSDIESIEVLKDVSASAIYGSDNERFHISGNYTSQDGVIRGTGFTRLGARLNYEREFAETPMDCRYLDLVV